MTRAKILMLTAPRKYYTQHHHARASIDISASKHLELPTIPVFVSRSFTKINFISRVKMAAPENASLSQKQAYKRINAFFRRDDGQHPGFEDLRDPPAECFIPTRYNNRIRW